MEFFDKLGKKASEAYKVTADKTGKLAKEAKLRMKISELKSQINDIYKEIEAPVMLLNSLLGFKLLNISKGTNMINRRPTKREPPMKVFCIFVI